MINKAPFTLAPPSLDDFKGQNVGAYLRALTKFLVALVRWLQLGGGGDPGGGPPLIPMARGPAGAIAAGATATVTLYDGLTLGSGTVTVRNPGPDTVPAGPKRLWLVRSPGVTEWTILLWSCADDA